MGDIRKVAKKIKNDPDLARQLWATENIDARLLALLIIKPKQLSSDELDEMVRTTRFFQVADWLNAYIVKKHPDRESFREVWMNDTNPMAARAGWNLTAIRAEKQPEGLDLAALLDRIEAELADAHEHEQWTMNMALVQIGINHPKHRQRALAIGEKLGVYSDFPVPRGCTSPFAPIWINEMVSRQG